MIYDKIAEYLGGNFDNWHTPGHKGELDSRDITELMDGDYFPSSAVVAAEKNATKIFGCKHLRFLTNGSSIGIKAALMAVDGDIITGSNNHRAVAEGLTLARRGAVIIDNNVVDDLKMPITPAQADKAFMEHPHVKALLITTPDYYGFVAAKELAFVAKKHNKLLIADSAHGAHFSGSKLFPESFASFADICNMSAHKTLNAYTQTAYLAINNDQLLDRVDKSLALLGTTSPSYLFLAQLEAAAERLQNSSEAYGALYERVKKFKACVPCLANDDFSRLVIDASEFSMTGKAMAQYLFSCGVMAEMYDARYVVFIATLADDDAKFDRLAKAILSKKLELKAKGI